MVLKLLLKVSHADPSDLLSKEGGLHFLPVDRPESGLHKIFITKPQQTNQKNHPNNICKAH